MFALQLKKRLSSPNLISYLDRLLKSDNLQYNTLAGTKDSLTKESDVPRITFCHNFLQNSVQILFQFIFLFFL